MLGNICNVKISIKQITYFYKLNTTTIG